MSAAFEIEAVEPASVPLASLTRDPELVCRARGINKATVSEYAAAMRSGVVFPPVVVFVDAKGAHLLADGFHRTAAAELAGIAEIAADVRQGGRREALLHAAQANGSHGLRRTTADKRRAVALVVAAYPKWSDRKIGEACGVDHKTVSATRKKAEPSGEIPHDADRQGAQLSKAIEKLVTRWPVDRADELVALVTGWLGRATPSVAVDQVASKPKRRNGHAAKTPVEASAADGAP